MGARMPPIVAQLAWRNSLDGELTKQFTHFVNAEGLNTDDDIIGSTTVYHQRIDWYALLVPEFGAYRRPSQTRPSIQEYALTYRYQHVLSSPLGRWLQWRAISRTCETTHKYPAQNLNIPRVQAVNKPAYTTQTRGRFCERNNKKLANTPRASQQ